MRKGTRILSLWMPRLPVNRFGRTGWPVDATPFAVIHNERNAQRLYAVNALALEKGLRPGMGLSDALGTYPDLLTTNAEPHKDVLFLKTLQRWTEQYSPWTASSGDNSLLINITGCAHLFAGEQKMATLIVDALADLHVEAKAGIADTKGAARAAAQFGGSSPTIILPGKNREELTHYPIEALTTEEKDLHDLKHLGLHRIGDLYPLKSSDFARRFGFGLLRRFEKLIGTVTDPMTPTAPQPALATRMSFPDPIGLRQDVDEALKRLATGLCNRLHRNQYATRNFRLSLQRCDKVEHFIDIGLIRPTQEPAPILRQFSLKLGKLDAGPGIDMMRLQAVSAEPYMPVQKGFADGAALSGTDDLIATIANRLGFDRVLRWEPVSSHLPQRSFKLASALDTPVCHNWPPSTKTRPCQLVDHELVEVETPDRPPAVFRWRGQTFETDTAYGPERICSEWWHGSNGDPTRDYWRIQTKQGPRLWLATRPDKRPPEWDVAGIFP